MHSTSARKSVRYNFRAQVDISQDQKRIAFGTLIDISVDGLGFTASPSLQVGETYLVTIRDVTTFECKIMQCTNFDRYGAKLLLSDRGKRKLAQRLEKTVNDLGLKEAEWRSNDA